MYKALLGSNKGKIDQTSYTSCFYNLIPNIFPGMSKEMLIESHPRNYFSKLYKKMLAKINFCITFAALFRIRTRKSIFFLTIV
jgi:hypothetical protein